MTKFFEKNVYSESLIAGEDLSSKQYYLVKIDSSGEIITTDAGEFAVGVIATNPKEGEIGQVIVLGAVPVVYGDDIVAGSMIKSDASGKAVPSTTGEHYVCGVALESGAADEIHTIILVSVKK